MEYKFYQTYINLLEEDRIKRNKLITYKSLDVNHKPVDFDFERKLLNFDFRKFVLNKLGYNIETIKMIIPAIQGNMLRPQRLFIDKEDFYVACDMITNTYYICYKNLMMIDIDFYKNKDQDKEYIIEQFEKDNNNCWKLYLTRNGIHAFLVSKKINYHSDESLQLMLNFKRQKYTTDEKNIDDTLCDFYYILYSYIRGFCVRLNKKKDEEKMEYLFIQYTGNKDLIDINLDKLVNLHIDYIHLFTNHGISLMAGQ